MGTCQAESFHIKSLRMRVVSWLVQMKLSLVPLNSSSPQPEDFMSTEHS